VRKENSGFRRGVPARDKGAALYLITGECSSRGGAGYQRQDTGSDPEQTRALETEEGRRVTPILRVKAKPLIGRTTDAKREPRTSLSDATLLSVNIVD
jgi:hypothetical protein